MEDDLEDLSEVLGLWTKEESLYLDKAPEEYASQNVNCSTCAFYEAGTCQLIEDSTPISPEGYCRFWVLLDPNDDEEDEGESMDLSQSIESLNSDEDLLYILATLQNPNLPQYKFEALLENLVNDLCGETQELSASKAVSLTKKDKNEKGGLTASGRSKYNSKGSNLKAPVDRKPKSPEELRRQGSFLTRMYNRKKIPPLKKPDGTPTRYALQASVWDSPIPKNQADVRRLAAKGDALLKRYATIKEKGKQSKKKQKLSQTIQELPICLSNGLLRIPIAMKGAWNHELHGVVAFNDADFEQIKKESSKEVLGFTPYVTLGHPTNLGYETVDAELKKGNLVGWEENEDTLFGLFDSKEDIVSYVKNGEYEYSSGEFIRNYKDKFTGENKGTVLMRVALTNSPFLPFGDSKIEALSQNVPLNRTTFMVKLSTDNTKLHNIPPEPISMEEMNTKEPVVEVPTLGTGVAAPVIEEAKPAVSAVNSIASAGTTFDINKLVETITAQVSKSSQNTLDTLSTKYESIIQGLNAQVEGLKTQLTQQQEVTQAFSNSLSQQAKNANYAILAKSGVSPALIQKFSLIESALEGGQKVIKLSNSAGQSEDKTVLEIVQELLVDAVKAEPIQYQQLGQTITPKESNTVDMSIRELIAKNIEAAKRK